MAVLAAPPPPMLAAVLKRVTTACSLCLALLPAAAAEAAAPAAVEVGTPSLTKPVDGRVALLIPVRYPVEMAGRQVGARVVVRVPGLGSRGFRVRARAGLAPKRHPERRRFTYVHAIELNKRWSRRAWSGARPVLTVFATARLDVDGDGKPEAFSRDRSRARVVTAAGALECQTLPQLHVRPGRKVAVGLPRCGAPLRWTNLSGKIAGRAWIRGGRLVYRAPKRFRGSVSVRLAGDVHPGGRAAARGAGKLVSRTVQIKVGGAAKLVVRAMGDSVTAGFGFYDNGEEMTIGQLFSCKPAEDFYNDACSSNSVSRSNTGKRVEYAPDYGLANNISWAAQWANRYGIGDYKNYAVTGSEPINWLPGGQLYATAKKIWAEDPDYILMTMGANPLLSEMLVGVDKMGCAIWADVFGEYRKCVEEAFAGVKLDARLRQIYRELIVRTDATVVLMQYHLSVPAAALAYSSTQIAEMGALLNERIARIAAEVEPKRLRVVAPPHFNVGVDISPVYPSRFSCSRFGYEVDGPSVQSTPTQAELLVTHPLSFCSGPASGPPWVISGDTGIHPSAAGYAQMSSRVPAPVR